MRFPSGDGTAVALVIWLLGLVWIVVPMACAAILGWTTTEVAGPLVVVYKEVARVETPTPSNTPAERAKHAVATICTYPGRVCRSSGE